jgi:aryl-alcohol dehydrogenase-like predicted oxidoreductase
LLARKCGLTCVFTNGFWYFIWKILTGESHPKARLTLFRNTLDTTEQSTQATRLYHEIAIKNGLTLTELSLAFIEQQPVTSTIIGATTVEQLKENIDTIQVTLSEEVLKAIDAVQAAIPDPAP